ncbi:MAG: hypothetical protein IPM51_14880 [Sphingobacteriaceae bacterium]|nr:hypothetical protein [Sphingobacteriaceae bacterium]
MAKINTDFRIKLTVLLIIFTLPCIFAQKLQKKDAELLLDKTITFLKVSDEMSFVQLWDLNNVDSSNHQIQFTIKDIKEHFKELKLFLDTAINNRLPIKDIEVNKLDKIEQAEYLSKYKISGYFDYPNSVTKGISFYVNFKKGAWYYKFSPDYTVLVKETKK